MLQTETYSVSNLNSPIRISDLPSGTFNLIRSRKGIKKAIKKGWITINGKQATTADFLTGGELIKLEIHITKRPRIELELDVLYEDESLAVIDKPAGIEVSGNKKWTIENALIFNLKGSEEIDVIQPEAIHRLDYPTTGVLLVGKTRSSVTQLNAQFSTREVEKTYHAVTIGKMERKGIIEVPIDGKSARTSFQVQKTIKSNRFEFLNLVKVKIDTGRRHQIRKHFHSIGNPILGDKDYFKKGLILHKKGLYLHASSLAFNHPKTKQQVLVNSPLPKKFNKLFE